MAVGRRTIIDRSPQSPDSPPLQCRSTRPPPVPPVFLYRSTGPPPSLNQSTSSAGHRISPLPFSSLINRTSDIADVSPLTRSFIFSGQRNIHNTVMDSACLNQNLNLDESNKVENSGLSQNKRPKEFSDVWGFFKKTYIGEDGIQRVECKACKKEYKSGGKRYGTSTLKRHLERCKLSQFHNVGQMILDHDGKMKSRKINQKISRGLVASAVIKHDLPFSFVEYDGIRAWMKYLNPAVHCISRNTLVSDIEKTYLGEKEKLKQVLAKINNRICLTSDLWTACTSEGYICLTAHFVDDNWKLNSKILNFAHMPPPHSGVELAAKLFEFLKEWGIEKKIFSLTLDNASSNDSMQDILKDQLSLHDSLLCDGEFFHVRCCAHILNLIVQEGLKIAVGALNKIRDSVKYVKGSESRKKKFEECVRGVGNIDTRIGLRLDVSTRWNSTYLMLESAIKYKKAFSALQLNDKNYKYCPSTEEWKRGEKIAEFLEPFYDTTNLISGSSYPTSNLYFFQVWKIESLLYKNLFNEDVVIGDMCRQMKEKFDKYWTQYSKVLAFGAILDPRVKFSLLEFFYSKVEPDFAKCKEKMSLVKGKLYKLYKLYEQNTGNGTDTSSYSQSQSSSIGYTRTQSEGMKGNGKKIFDEIMEYESQTVTSAGKSQLDSYLEEPKLEFAHYEDLDVLEYWKNHKHRYPTLALMACDVLAIPITTVASESSFSIGARVLTKYRSSTLPEKVQTLICTRNWLHGYVDDIDSEDGTKNRATLPDEGEGATVFEIIDDEEADIKE